MTVKGRHILLIGLLAMTAWTHAESRPTTHNFATMTTKSQITFRASNKQAITPLLIYSCANTASFGTYAVSGSQFITLNLPSEGDFVTTSAIDSLTKIVVNYYFDSGKQPALTVQLSRDSVHWTDSLPLTTHASGINAYLEMKTASDRYYVRISNTASKTAAYIFQIDYTQDEGCNSKLYIPE